MSPETELEVGQVADVGVGGRRWDVDVGLTPTDVGRGRGTGWDSMGEGVEGGRRGDTGVGGNTWTRTGYVR